MQSKFTKTQVFVKIISTFYNEVFCLFVRKPASIDPGERYHKSQLREGRKYHYFQDNKFKWKKRKEGGKNNEARKKRLRTGLMVLLPRMN